MVYFQSYTQAELADLLRPLSRIKRRAGKTDEELERMAERQARYRAKQLFHWVYQRFVTDWDQMSDLSKELRSWLKENMTIYRLEERHARQAEDGTRKFLWDLIDGKTIESVIIPAALQEKEDIDGAENQAGYSVQDLEVGATGAGRGESKSGAFSEESSAGEFSGRPVKDGIASARWSRLTACISSQVGCAMACKFCLTGVQGLDRHLQVHEIVTQIFELRRLAPITNIVFMGMGEPLHNYENVVKACRIFLDQDAFGFSKRKVTVSTSGLVPAIRKLGQDIDVSLAISLNGTTDEQRASVMPVNKAWNIKALLGACREYPLGSHRRITFEYVLLRGVNDAPEDAIRLAGLVAGIPSKINLIPFNEHSGASYKRTGDAEVRAFQKILLDRGLTATVRISRGRDILAACGQLRSIFGTARGTDRHKDWKPLPVIQPAPLDGSPVSGVS